MARVTGIGGVFFKARDPLGLADFYARHLGVPVEEAGVAGFRWRSPDELGDPGTTVWSPFPDDTDYFSPGRADWMLNYRVDDLDGMLAQLRQAGVEVDQRVEASELGRFGWGVDPEGNRFELWEPAPGM